MGGCCQALRLRRDRRLENDRLSHGKMRLTLLIFWNLDYAQESAFRALASLGWCHVVCE